MKGLTVCLLVLLLLPTAMGCGHSSRLDIERIENDLKYGDWKLRLKAVGALDYIGPQPEVVKILAETLRDDNLGVCLRATSVLGGMGHKARPATPALLEVLGDEDPLMRDAVITALGAIGPSSEVVPSIITALDDEVFYVRSQAIIILAKIGSEAALALPKLRELADSDPYIDTDNGEYRIRILAEKAINAIEGEEVITFDQQPN